MTNNDILQYIKERNDADHQEIKKDIKFIKDILAPKVAANEKAITIILIIIAGAGFYKAFAF